MENLSPVYSQKDCGCVKCVLWSQEGFMAAGGVYGRREEVKRVESIVILNEVV